MIERSGGSIAEAAFLRSLRSPRYVIEAQPATISVGQRNSSGDTQIYASAAQTLPSSPLPNDPGVHSSFAMRFIWRAVVGL